MLVKNFNEQNDFISGHLFHVGEENRWEQRLTDSCGLILTLGGTGHIFFENTVRDLAKGDLLLMKPQWRHRFYNAGDWDYLWFHFLPRPHVSIELEWPEAIPGAGVIHLEGSEFDAVAAALIEAHSLEFRRPPRWNALAFLLLESAVVRGYSRSLIEMPETDTCVLTAQKLLRETGESIDEIARHCGMSRAALYEKFRKATGASPRRYREQAILRRAAHLLECFDLTVAEVADQVGISNAYYFSTRFRKFFGISPHAYRKQYSRRPAAN